MTPEKVLILDTTLRDGEQTAGVSFNADEKLTLAKILLEELKVNRIEVCSARVSEGEFHMLSRLCSWAGTRGYIDRVEALGFVDGGLSIVTRPENSVSISGESPCQRFPEAS